MHAHAAIFLTWMALFTTQVRLIASGNRRLHRRLGLAGAAFAALMVIVGFFTAVGGARRGIFPGAPFDDPLAFLIVPVGDLAIFAPLVACAIIWRRRPEVHKRLMLLAVVGGLLPAPIGRLPIIAGQVPGIVVVFLAMLLAGPAYDVWSRRRIHPIYFAVVPIFLSVPLRLALANTQAWHRIAEWLVR